MALGFSLFGLGELEDDKLDANGLEVMPVSEKTLHQTSSADARWCPDELRN